MKVWMTVFQARAATKPKAEEERDSIWVMISRWSFLLAILYFPHINRRINAGSVRRAQNYVLDCLAFAGVRLRAHFASRLHRIFRNVYT